MKQRLFLLVLLLFCSCRSLPAIQSIGKTTDQFDQKLCYICFNEGNWQFIHSIESTMPNKKKAFVMGITNISSETREIKVVIITIEGLVLFDAEYNGEVKIHKGISPFDSKEFANGLMDDIRLIFYKPEGRLDHIGYYTNGLRVCRYKDDEGFVVDINFNKGGSLEIRKYNKYNRLIRLVTIASINGKQRKNKAAIHQKIELIGYGRQKYTLMLDLIEAKRLPN